MSFAKRTYRKCYTCGHKNPLDFTLILCESCHRKLRIAKTRYGPDRKKYNENLPEVTARTTQEIEAMEAWESGEAD
jgi:hypothetical protein